MKLLVAELKSELYQELTTSDNINIEAVRVHIYKHNAPAGSLKVVLADANGRTIKESDAVTITDISAVAFAHGYVKFPVVYSIKKNTTFRVYLRPTGYTFSESAYVGWCNDFDLRKYPATFSPSSGTRAALDMEVWGYSEAVR